MVEIDALAVNGSVRVAENPHVSPVVTGS